MAERIFSVLSSFDHAHRAMPLSQIAKRCGLPTPTTYRMLTTLEGLGAIDRTPAGLYCIGPLVWELGVLSPTHDVIGQGLRSVLLQLAIRGRMIVRVHGLREQRALCLEEVLPNGASDPGGGAGRSMPLSGCAAGHVILATMGETAPTRPALGEPEGSLLARIVRAVQEQGWALTTDRYNGTEYAVPIHATGRPPMALSAAPLPGHKPDKTPVDRPNAVQEQRLLAEMKVVAAHVAKALSETPGLDSPMSPPRPLL
ncbi:helix-turn-helix domain-containing protein [Nesterenkonia sp. DZ6]|uniref:IclR family transcriptional regulator n=1 Tax=Nesterenkonia sp. DZ6 TaxID=2901229 RepID=UPI001F4C6590|nr:helix-turn-helix domain-containing protein [Nesterenkonia sp. DZ6]